MVCDSTGTCVNKPTCTDTQCQGLGQAYYCDTSSQTCQLGCSPAGCSGATKDCNPCPAGQTCDTSTHTCNGGSTCDCTSLNCAAQGMVCDSNSCSCVTTGGGGGGGGGTGADGDSCLQDADCQSGLGCYGAIPQFSIPGTCTEVCTSANYCFCSGTKQCYNSLGQAVACWAGLEGKCQ